MRLLRFATCFQNGYISFSQRTCTTTFGSVRLLSSTNNYILKSPIPDVSFPHDVSLPQLIMQRARKFNDRVAMVDAVSGQQHTFRDLANNMERVASALVQRGFQKDDVMCIYSGNCINYAYLIMGAMYAGGVVTTINPAYTTDEVLYQLNDSNPKFFTCGAANAEVGLQACEKYGMIKEMFSFGDIPNCTNISTLLSEEPQPIPPHTVNAKEDVVLLPYSSGTTGRAKGVMLTHYNMVANLYQFNNPVTDLDLQEDGGETYLLVLPLFHLYGIFALMLQAFFKGNKMVFLPGFDPVAYMSCIEKYKVTMIHIVPPMAIVLVNHPAAKNYDFSSLHSALMAAAPSGKELEENLKDVLKVMDVKQGYGMTETSPVITMSPKEGSKHGSVGIPMPNTECMIVDIETGESLPAHKEGEIWTRGPQNMKGYLNRPDATAETLDCDGWLHTGDLGYYDEDSHVYISDRLKELIKYKGFQVAPAELEALLLTHAAVADAAVIGVPDDKAGELPKAFIVLKSGHDATEEEIQNFVADNLSLHKHLRGGVEFINAIPKSPSGKILRRFLRNAAK